MLIISAALSGALILTVLAPSAAAEFGTRQEAIEMVKSVQAKVKNEGIGATVLAINNKPKEFIDRDLYPFIIRLDGIMLANPSGSLRSLTLLPVIDGGVVHYRARGGEVFPGIPALAAAIDGAQDRTVTVSVSWARPSRR